MSQSLYVFFILLFVCSYALVPKEFPEKPMQTGRRMKTEDMEVH